jgi:predicted RNA polymerase sigma factor
VSAGGHRGGRCRHDAAAAAYRKAIALAPTGAEKRYLGRRLAEVTSPYTRKT